MSNDIQFIDIDAPEYAKAPKPLRDHIRKLQQTYRDAVDERDFYWGHAASAALRGPLADFTNPERVKRELLNDGIDPLNPEAVTQWLHVNGDDFARDETR